MGSDFHCSDVYKHYLETISEPELSAEFRAATRLDSSAERVQRLWAINIEMYNRARKYFNDR
ncbi:MAG: hypothetical protein A3F13_02760 [Gammaproteobacteria bacterium RIFCSPHIGHO2_12_FULL_40_19]|nr:MAG: hypothetical protein A3F13_02760 [Gammaproteobacteria bacterium RIFCSPHIGHO2_12_FULL_40_19]